MGTVRFVTDVDKTVDIRKNVQIDVDKSVETNVDLKGSLASAEASADAVGGTGGGTGERVKVPFVPDNLTEEQEAEANPAVTNPAVSVINVPGADTDFNNLLQRTLFAQVLSDNGEGDIAVQIVQPGKLTFDQGDGTFSNSYAKWDIPGGEDPFPEDDNQGIIDDFLANVNPASPNPFANVGYTFTFSDIDFDPGVDAENNPATVRVSFVVEDTGGDRAITTVAFVPDGTTGGGFTDLSITGPFAGFIFGGAAPPPGTVIDSEDSTDPTAARIVLLGTDSNPAVNLDQLASFQILLEDDPDDPVGVNSFSSGDFFALDSVIDETLSVSGTDASTRWIWSTIEEEEDVFNIAETETFAQVTEDGAFSFSDALAATNARVLDDLI